jgi:hypothetical protein
MCPLHKSIKLIDGACTSCLLGSPPDLGVKVIEEVTVEEKISGG